MRLASYLMSLPLAIAPTYSLSILAQPSILLPLYAGPDKWPAVYDTIASHPDIPFRVIVNPDSGPGSDIWPDETFFTGIEKLNSYPNVQLLGYVHTSYTAEPHPAVNANVTSYSAWSSKGSKNITLSGIFFDEAPQANDKAQIDYMHQVSEFAKSNDLPLVVFNPGAALAEGSEDGYYKDATYIVEFENSVAEWSNFAPENLSQKYRPKQAVIAYGATSDSDYESVVKDAQEKGLGAVYLTPGNDYMSPGTVSKVAEAFVSR